MPPDRAHLAWLRRAAERESALAAQWQRLADWWFAMGDVARAAVYQELATLAAERAARLLDERAS
jgi:hypothetical protein